MTFDILQHLDKLTPDGGKNHPRGEHSYQCPVCQSSNFKVNHSNGKWNCYGCSCSDTESGKRKIREAISPAKNPDDRPRHIPKPIRPRQKRSWDYYSNNSDRQTPLIRVHRIDSGKEGERPKRWQESFVEGSEPGDLSPNIFPYRYAEARKAIDDGDGFVYWVEGEPCTDAMWKLGLPAVTSLGGCEGFKPDRDGGLFPPEKVVIVPDRDQCGLTYAKKVAAEYPGCRWLYPYPNTPEWNGSCPKDGGWDIADWIDEGVTIEQIIDGIGDIYKHHLDEPLPTNANNSRDDVLTYRQLMNKTLRCIVDGDEDSEMQCRAELKTRFRITDDQIGTKLFRLYSDSKIAKVEAKSNAIDFNKVEALSYRMDGWMQKGDICLTFGCYGTGKTTHAINKAYNLAHGRNILDRSTPCKPGKTLFIATDSGAGPLEKACQDLGLDPTTDPKFILDHPEQMIWVWAHDPKQGLAAWVCSINDITRLDKFIADNNIEYIVIDSAKSVSACAGWSYTSNESVKALLQLLREGIAQPHNCFIEILSHDGRDKGTHAGAKAWAEDPSMVCSMTKDLRDDGSQRGVTIEFKKDRAAVSNPHRTVSYQLEDQQIVLRPDMEKVGTCAEAIVLVLWEAYKNGLQKVATKDLADQLLRDHQVTRKTMENTLPGLKRGKRQLVVSKGRGFVALAQSEIERRDAADLEEEQRIQGIQGDLI